MRRLLALILLVATLSLSEAYSKYGRTCQDIGCTSKEVCVMKEDPCSIYSRNDCGKYPTCVKVSNAASTCATFICPPTQICKMDGGQPKCFDDPAAMGTRENKRPVQSYNIGSPGGDAPSAPVFPSSNNYPQNPNYNQNNNPYNPNYPQNPGVYPHVPSGGGLAPGQTTSKPNVYQPGQRVSGGGYQGGQVGSGYPGGSYPRQNGGYPTQGGGYPGQSYPGQGYPGQQYPGHSYPGQSYPGQSYPGQSYPGQSYPGGSYPKQQSGGSYPKQGQNYPGYGYGTRSGQDSSTPLVDRITDTLKTLGLFWFLVKYAMSRVYGICT